MSDLISRQTLIERFRQLKGSDSLANMFVSDVIKAIQNQPTAYDVDKVVEQLKEKTVLRANSEEFWNNPQNGEYVDEVVKIEDAIEIVKGGTE